MRKELVESLKRRVSEIAVAMSNPDRDKNPGKEIFKIHQIIPTSESSAVAIFEKLPSHKLALCTLFFINAGESFWLNFFPTDSHFLGMRKLESLMQEVEVGNFDKN